jgi:virulence-associated protein VagC
MPEAAAAAAEHAELFTDDGGRQAVRMAPGYEFEGDRVRVSRLGRGVLIEPAGADAPTFDAAAMFAQIDQEGGLDVFAAFDHRPGKAGDS